MTVKVSDNSDLDQLISDLEIQPRSFLSSEMPRLMNEVKQRTEAGLDFANRPFQPYKNPTYAQLKQRAVGKATPNLRLTGQMMNSLSWAVRSEGDRVGGVIRVGDEDKARWNQGENSNIRPRMFMALSQAQIDRLAEQMYSFIR